RLRFDRREDPRRGTHPARPPSGGDRRGPAQPTARPNLRAPRPRQHHRRRLSSPTMPPATPPLLLTPGHVSLDTLRRIVAEDRAVTLDPAALVDVERSAALVADAAAGDAAVYGVNTGFGKLAQQRIAPADTGRLQRNLILSHCCGVGTPTPRRLVRLMIALKLLSLGRGASGVRPALLAALEGLLVHDVTPIVPRQGSVGASGDLAPLAHVGAVLLGEGEAEVAGERLPAGEALRRVGLAPLELAPKEGLALINGTQFSCALALA